VIKGSADSQCSSPPPVQLMSWMQGPCGLSNYCRHEAITVPIPQPPAGSTTSLPRYKTMTRTLSDTPHDVDHRPLGSHREQTAVSDRIQPDNIGSRQETTLRVVP
jgi:hypothetical protein